MCPFPSMLPPPVPHTIPVTLSLRTPRESGGNGKPHMARGFRHGNSRVSSPQEKAGTQTSHAPTALLMPPLWHTVPASGFEVCHHSSFNFCLQGSVQASGPGWWPDRQESGGGTNEGGPCPHRPWLRGTDYPTAVKNKPRPSGLIFPGTRNGSERAFFLKS